MTPEALAQIHAASFTDPRPWSATEFASLLSGPGVFVVSESQGFALGRTVADEAELLTIAVAPEARRCGIGAQLVTAFLARARQAGAETAFLEVAADNAPALALYFRAGFHQTALRKGYYPNPDGVRIDALILRHNLGHNLPHRLTDLISEI